MKIGITGANGFIGWHLRCYLKTQSDVSEVRTADRTVFSDRTLINKFVKGLDIIIHLAGVNRANDGEIISGNIEPAESLVQAMNHCNSSATVLFSSSTYAQSDDTAYGRSKANASRIFSLWASESDGKFINLIIPHVFGEHGRPYYNSAVATFCHQIANGDNPSITSDNQLELIHVQDLIEIFFKVIEMNIDGDYRVKGKPITVIEVADKLIHFRDEYINNNILPDLSEPIDRNLFNTYRAALPVSNRVVSPTLHEDARGWLVETIKAGSGGQCFVSTTKPGITRGNHYHLRKVERFFILRGKARIQLRKIYSDETITYEIDGNTPSYIDIPTLHTHNITNIGSDELITLFWADELFDPDNPDTYFEEV